MSQQVKYCSQSLVNWKYGGTFFSGGEIAAFHYIAQPVCEELIDEGQVRWRWVAGEEVSSPSFPLRLGKF